jgi:hypothetical protein
MTRSERFNLKLCVFRGEDVRVRLRAHTIKTIQFFLKKELKNKIKINLKKKNI